jgi:hypothetical protein
MIRSLTLIKSSFAIVKLIMLDGYYERMLGVTMARNTGSGDDAGDLRKIGNQEAKL